MKQNKQQKKLVHWYGSVASDWKITEQTVIATSELVDGTIKCSGLFEYVPTPSGAMTGAGALESMASNYAKDAVKRSAADNSYYNSCVVTQALYRKSAIQETTFY